MKCFVGCVLKVVNVISSCTPSKREHFVYISHTFISLHSPSITPQCIAHDILETKSFSQNHSRKKHGAEWLYSRLSHWSIA